MRPDSDLSREIMEYGANGNQEEVCRFAKTLGCYNYEIMPYARDTGQNGLDLLSFQWGVTDFDLVLCLGIQTGNVMSCLDAIAGGGKESWKHAVRFANSPDLDPRILELVNYYGVFCKNGSIYSVAYMARNGTLRSSR
jgi:hypothetical protein